MQLKQAIENQRPVYVEGPIGDEKNAASLRPFVQNIKNVEYLVLVSAGSGMTPMLQLLEYTLGTKSIYPKLGIVWVGCHSSMDEVEMCKSQRLHFNKLAEKAGLKWHEMFYLSEQKVQPVATETQEIISHRLRDTSDLKQLPVFAAENQHTALTFVCGSPMFSLHIGKLMDDAGVSRRNVFSFQ